jgi:hypothetical protein
MRPGAEGDPSFAGGDGMSAGRDLRVSSGRDGESGEENSETGSHGWEADEEMEQCAVNPCVRSSGLRYFLKPDLTRLSSLRMTKKKENP